jgi:hypothetical protein
MSLKLERQEGAAAKEERKPRKVDFSDLSSLNSTDSVQKRSSGTTRRTRFTTYRKRRERERTEKRTKMTPPLLIRRYPTTLLVHQVRLRQIRRDHRSRQGRCEQGVPETRRRKAARVEKEKAGKKRGGSARRREETGNEQRTSVLRVLQIPKPPSTATKVRSVSSEQSAVVVIRQFLKGGVRETTSDETSSSCKGADKGERGVRGEKRRHHQYWKGKREKEKCDEPARRVFLLPHLLPPLLLPSVREKGRRSNESREEKGQRKEKLKKEEEETHMLDSLPSYSTPLRPSCSTRIPSDRLVAAAADLGEERRRAAARSCRSLRLDLEREEEVGRRELAEGRQEEGDRRR